MKVTQTVSDVHDDKDLIRKLVEDLAHSQHFSMANEEASDLAALSAYLMAHGITQSDVTPIILKHLQETSETVSISV